MSDNGESQARLLSLIPVTATLNFNTGQNNARSISLDANLEGISLSESNSYNYPGHSDGYVSEDLIIWQFIPDIRKEIYNTSFAFLDRKG